MPWQLCWGGVELELGLLAVGEGAGTMLICAGQEAPEPGLDTPAKGGCSLAPWGRGGFGGRDAGSSGSLLAWGEREI